MSLYYPSKCGSVKSTVVLCSTVAATMYKQPLSGFVTIGPWRIGNVLHNDPNVRSIDAY